MLNNHMDNAIDIFDANIDVSYFNNLLVKHGGKPLKIAENKIKMRNFILKLIKTFRKDFNKKIKKGGMMELFDNDSLISYATKFGNLSYDTVYTFPPIVQMERDLL